MFRLFHEKDLTLSSKSGSDVIEKERSLHQEAPPNQEEFSWHLSGVYYGVQWDVLSSYFKPFNSEYCMCNTKTLSPKKVLWPCVAAMCMLWSVTAHAQDERSPTSFQVEHFEPLPSQGTNILNIGKSDVVPHLKPSAGVVFHYVDSPLRLVNGNDEDQVAAVLIENQLKGELWGSFGLFDFAEIGFMLPLVIFQNGDQLDVLGRNYAVEGFNLADARIVPKLRLPMDRSKLGGFGASLIVPVYVPIGDTETFNSDGTVRVEPRLAVDWQHSVGITISGNVGYQIRQPTTTRNIVTDDVIRYGLGLELPTGVKNFQIIGSLFGNIPTAGDAEGIAAGLENRSNPREALGGLQYRIARNFVVNAGAGAGLSSGVGSPRFRAFATLGYTPSANGDSDGDGILDENDQCPRDPEDRDDYQDEDGCPDLDNDIDGILDTEDECPMEPEDKDDFEDANGCPDPDNDQDGVLDVEDKCPLEAGSASNEGCPILDKDGDGISDDVDVCPDEPEDKDAFEDGDGCPDPDNDQDGVLDEVDQCSADKEDKDGFEDEDGCPDIDNDKDGILDAEDKCPNEPEIYNGNKDDDGCPDKGKPKVEIKDNTIVILQKIFFDTNKATIKRKSYSVLDVVVTVLKQNPQITKLSIEGHTDDMGKDENNLDLSKRRAAAVVEYLKKKGIDEGRMSSEGYGETRPLCKDISEDMLGKRSRKKAIRECRETNRRVEFKVIEIDGKPVKKTTTIEVEKTP